MKNNMTNEKVIIKFLQGETKGGTPTRNVLQGVYEYKMKTLYIRDNELINYNTTIAKRKENKILLNNKKYSATTSKIQNMIRRLCNDLNIEIEIIE